MPTFSKVLAPLAPLYLFPCGVYRDNNTNICTLTNHALFVSLHIDAVKLALLRTQIQTYPQKYQ